MDEDEILSMWRSGIDKNKLAEIYKRRHNQYIRIIRASVRHRHDGRLINKKEALYVIERVIYKNIQRK